MLVFSGKASSPTNTKGKGGSVVLGSDLVFGMHNVPLSSAFPNSELEKTPPLLCRPASYIHNCKPREFDLLCQPVHHVSSLSYL